MGQRDIHVGYSEHPPIRNTQIYTYFINFEKSHSYNHALLNHQSGWKLAAVSCSSHIIIACALKKIVACVIFYFQDLLSKKF